MLEIAIVLGSGLHALAARLRGQQRAYALSAAAGLMVHAAAIVLATAHADGLRISVTAALSLMAWQAALLLWLGRASRALDPLRLPAHAVAAATLLLMLLPEPEQVVLLSGWRAGLHLVLSLLSLGLLTLGAIQAVLVAIQDRWLHDHAGRALRHLPPLATMEQLLLRFVAAGFAMLSLTLATGLAFVEDLFAQHLVHKTVLSLLAWAMLGVLLWGRWRHGWRGRTAVRWTLAGYAMLLLAYFGSKFVLEQLLGRPWH